jgi:nucleotide-binding universal stress UspA family protein
LTRVKTSAPIRASNQNEPRIPRGERREWNMFKNIVVAVDGSPTSIRGLRTAIDLAADQNAALHVVHVVDVMPIGPVLDGGYVPTGYLDQIIEALRESGGKLLARAQALADAQGVQTRPTMVEAYGGSVAHTILAEARKARADLIVLGTHGRRGLSRMLLGSDAETVLREARVPVLLVRKPERPAPRVIKRAPTRLVARKQAAGATARADAR